jgi:hypothetical protein
MPYAIQGHFDLKFQHVIDVFLAQLPQEPKVGGAALTVYHHNKKVVMFGLECPPKRANRGKQTI